MSDKLNPHKGSDTEAKTQPRAHQGPLNEFAEVSCKAFDLWSHGQVWKVSSRRVGLSKKLNALLGTYPGDSEFLNQEPLFQVNKTNLRACLVLKALRRFYEPL